MSTYPTAPGYKEKGGTSQEAAEDIKTKAATIREQIMQLFDQRGDITPDEAADILNLDILSVRPRFTELKLARRIEKTSATRPNRNGKNVRVWSRYNPPLHQGNLEL